MTKLEKLFEEYKSIIWRIENDFSEAHEARNELRLFWDTVQIMSIKTYYKLQAKIFIEEQAKNRELARAIVDDCMKLFGKFTLNSIEFLIDEMQFKNEELYKCNRARFYGLGLKIPMF